MTRARRYAPVLENVGLEILRQKILEMIDYSESQFDKGRDSATANSFMEGYLMALRHVLETMDGIAKAPEAER
jgi:hypothetical protein